MKEESNHIDKLFRDKFTDAESSEPMESWASVKDKLNRKGFANGNHPEQVQRKWNGSLSFLLFFVCASSISILVKDTFKISKNVPEYYSLNDRKAEYRAVENFSDPATFTNNTNENIKVTGTNEKKWMDIQTNSGAGVELNSIPELPNNKEFQTNGSDVLSTEKTNSLELQKTNALPNKISKDQKESATYNHKRSKVIVEELAQKSTSQTKVTISKNLTPILKAGIYETAEKHLVENPTVASRNNTHEKMNEESLSKSSRVKENSFQLKSRLVMTSKVHHQDTLMQIGVNENKIRENVKLGKVDNDANLSDTKSSNNANDLLSHNSSYPSKNLMLNEEQSNKSYTEQNNSKQLDSKLASPVVKDILSESFPRIAFKDFIMPSENTADKFSRGNVMDSTEMKILAKNLNDTLLQVKKSTTQKENKKFPAGITIGAFLLPGMSQVNNYQNKGAYSREAGMNDGNFHRVLDGGLSINFEIGKRFMIGTGIMTSTFTQRFQVSEVKTERDTLSANLYNPLSSSYEVKLNDSSIYNPSLDKGIIAIPTWVLPTEYRIKDSVYNTKSYKSTKYQYIGVPIMAGLNLGTGRLKLAIYSGIVLNIPVSKTSTMNISYDSSGVYPTSQMYIQSSRSDGATFTTFSTVRNDPFTVKAISTIRELANINWMYMGGLNLQYQVSKSIAFTAGPVLRYSLKSVFGKEEAYKTVPYSWSLQVGISYRIK